MMHRSFFCREMFSVDYFSQIFLSFIASWGYVAVAVLMAAENACIPIPSELILGFAGYLVFAGHMSFTGALAAGMIGGLLGSVFAYEVGARRGRPFVEKYGRYFLIKRSHVDVAQRWFDRYGLKAVFFSRMLPVVRTFISLPAGFARVNRSRFFLYTIAGALPWTAAILYAGLLLGERWTDLMAYGHEASRIFVVGAVIAIVVLYIRWKRTKRRRLR